METFVHNAHPYSAGAWPAATLLGVIAKTKAFFAGRVGPALVQPYYDLIKLYRKGIGHQHDHDLGIPGRPGRRPGRRRWSRFC